MTYEQTLALCRTYVAEHVLKLEVDAPHYKAFRMAKPNTRMYSVLICFTPEGITLSGDYRVTDDRAVSSDPGLGLDWFRGELDSYYLASKFLRERWVPEHCAKAILEKADEIAEEAGDEEAEGNHGKVQALQATASTLRAIAADCTAGADIDGVHELLQDALPAMVDADMPGYTYSYMERASLQAIQEKFAELYKAWAEKTPAAPTDWLRQSETYRMEIESSMNKYSTKLGWGLTGAQGECWTMLDLSVDKLVKLERELPHLATNIADLERMMRMDEPAHAPALRSMLAKLKELGVEPHQTAATGA